jgi:hypothetical protein
MAAVSPSWSLRSSASRSSRAGIPWTRSWRRRLLLVLDNCEHVIEPCAVLADALLRACPDLRIMATSRAALGIGGETAWLVPLLIIATVDGQQGRTDIRVAAWTERELLSVDGRGLPTTLFTRNWTDEHGVSHTAVVEARSGSFRTAEIAMHSGRYEQRFLVWIRTDGSVPHVGEYVYRGDYTYDFITQRFSLQSWAGLTLSAELLAGGALRITGPLEAGTPELLLDYSSQ